ncbi:dipeptidase [Paenibacillus gansuensis]|uniref:Dipeptidase n=1 Tax=Paenibacillus gansuensis TaxID=306542 RepID=A0ABW5PCL3_9BACL
MIYDGHCDVLGKMLEDASIHFEDDRKLDVTLSRLKAGGVKLQTFAIYVHEEEFTDRSIRPILQSVDLFYTRILHGHGLRFIKTKSDLQKLSSSNDLGALLHLEGVDGLGGDLAYLRILFYLGVRTLGVTWNYGNWAADGILEKRNGGFSTKGLSLIEECNRLGIILDVSHLSERAFWDLAEASKKPYLASHSNAYTICSHPRNLKDDQIRRVIADGGRIGITFVPYFVSDRTTVQIKDILAHTDHVCGMGGERSLVFGSDFDGIPSYIKGLEHPGNYPDLVNELQKHYPESIVNGLLYDNMYRFLEKELPDEHNRG